MYNTACQLLQPLHVVLCSMSLCQHDSSKSSIMRTDNNTEQETWNHSSILNLSITDLSTSAYLTTGLKSVDWDDHVRSLILWVLEHWMHVIENPASSQLAKVGRFKPTGTLTIHLTVHSGQFAIVNTFRTFTSSECFKHSNYCSNSRYWRMSS